VTRVSRVPCVGVLVGSCDRTFVLIVNHITDRRSTNHYYVMIL
jgi:hypothetical protein